MRIKVFLKTKNQKTAANVEFKRDLIDFALKIKSNAVIGEGKQAEETVNLNPSVSANVPASTNVTQDTA